MEVPLCLVLCLWWNIASKPGHNEWPMLHEVGMGSHLLARSDLLAALIRQAARQAVYVYILNRAKGGEMEMEWKVDEANHYSYLVKWGYILGITPRKQSEETQRDAMPHWDSKDRNCLHHAPQRQTRGNLTLNLCWRVGRESRISMSIKSSRLCWGTRKQECSSVSSSQQLKRYQRVMQVSQRSVQGQLEESHLNLWLWKQSLFSTAHRLNLGQVCTSLNLSVLVHKVNWAVGLPQLWEFFCVWCLMMSWDETVGCIQGTWIQGAILDQRNLSRLWAKWFSSGLRMPPAYGPFISRSSWVLAGTASDRSCKIDCHKQPSCSGKDVGTNSSDLGVSL